MRPIVAVVRDDRFLDHKTGHAHPESPARLSSIYRMLDRSFKGAFLPVTPEPAAMDRLELVHTAGHVKKILKTADQKITSLAPDTPVSSQSYLAAWLAAGACMQGVDYLMQGTCRTFFALVRPPGHHALPDRTTGFCLLNNLAIAARYAQKQYNTGKILIIDWDVHHGNGLNDIFYRDDDVYYFSTHDLMLFPYSGDFTDAGEEKGLGFTLNVPLPRLLVDEDVAALYQAILTPLFAGYKPDLVLIAAGFDAHKDDPLGRSAWTEKAYFTLALLIRRLAEASGGIPLLLSLEGGYDPGANAASAGAVLEALTTDKPLEDLDLTPAHPGQIAELLETVFTTHRSYGVLS